MENRIQFALNLAMRGELDASHTFLMHSFKEKLGNAQEVCFAIGCIKMARHEKFGAMFWFKRSKLPLADRMLTKLGHIASMSSVASTFEKIDPEERQSREEAMQERPEVYPLQQMMFDI